MAITSSIQNFFAVIMDGTHPLIHFTYPCHPLITAFYRIMKTAISASNKPIGLLIIFLVFLTHLSSCTSHSPLSTQESEISTMEATTPPSTGLPAQLFYLDEGQIWKLKQDGQKTTQITQESISVDAFDFNPQSQKLVFLSGNQLFLVDAEGHEREILVEGQPLPPLNDDTIQLTFPEDSVNAIHSPLWSQDGSQIAFIADGLQVLDLSTNQTQTIWRNSIDSSTPVIVDRLLSWSPDGNFFLVSKSTFSPEYSHQRSLGLIRVGEYMVDLSDHTDLTFAWSPDSQYVYLADANHGSDRSLMQCNLIDVQCKLIAEFEPGIRYYHYAYPFVNEQSQLYVWLGTSQEFGEPPENFQLESTQPGYGRTSLRDDQFPIQAALWAHDGSGVIIVISKDTDNHPSGSMLWLTLQGDSSLYLPPSGATNLRWGFSE